MASGAVVHFEITGKDSADLKRFYGILFGWVMRETPSLPGYYVIAANGPGIAGGIGPSRDGRAGQATFFVEVEDLAEHLSLAEELGGKIVRPPQEVSFPDEALTFALLADPEGHVVGLQSRGARRA